MSKDKGARGERELVNNLEAAGWMPMRAPSSGSATKSDLPDVIAGKAGVCIALEAKWWAGGTNYLDAEKVQALLRFADAYGAVPLGAFRFNDDTTWYFQNPVRLPTVKTDAANRRVKQSAAEQFPTLEELDQLLQRHADSDS